MIQGNDSEKRIFHMESNSPGWSLKEGKRDSLREKRRFIIRHVCTLSHYRLASLKSTRWINEAETPC